MPIISTVGSRSVKTRLVFAGMYLAVALGAVSMIYPLLLMLAGSVKSEADFHRNTPLPEYLWDDQTLWSKFLESKYSTIAQAEAALRRPIASWRDAKPPQSVEPTRASELRLFREQADLPVEWYALGHVRYRDILAKNARNYRKRCQERFGTIEAFSDAAGVNYRSWSEVGPPLVSFATRRTVLPPNNEYIILYALKEKAPRSDWILTDLDGDFWQTYIRPQWSTIQAYNAAHGTQFADYGNITLATRPPSAQAARKDWETYVREQLNPVFIRFAGEADANFQAYLCQLYSGQIGQLNRSWKEQFNDFNEVDLKSRWQLQARARTDVCAFLKDPQACPLEFLSIEGPRQAFERFVASHRGVSVQKIEPLALPTEAADWQDFQGQTWALRREFLARNYLAVFDFILLHGNGIRNTVIFCALAIATTLLVNPLAAYALSRYKPASTYWILLFCMATMAFPAEVTMIPSFLLLKRFPLYPLLIATFSGIGFIFVVSRLAPGWPKGRVAIAGIAIGILAGWWFAPWLAKRFGSDGDLTLSLLNTFWALILPGMANGFGIFLLKGFFDSLPSELYEAADLDGASELRKFWVITMSLSKPILAVLALGAFTAAYSEFLMALVIIPDQGMWTIMVWLYELQQLVHPAVRYASLVVAAVPTLLIFLFCQNLIMRGIIVPIDR